MTTKQTQKPAAGDLLYKANGQIRARVESVQYVDDKMYYTIRRFINTRQEFAKTTSTYAWRER